jgi:integrase
VALRADHFGFARTGGDGSILTVRVPGKGDKERILPVPQKLKELLEQYMEREGIEMGQARPLFQPVRNNLTKIKTKPLHAASIYYVVRKYAARAGVDRKVSPHSCRATCISNALDHAASHRSVQQLAGWSSPLMIERYDKRRTELRDSAVHTVAY